MINKIKKTKKVWILCTIFFVFIFSPSYTVNAYAGARITNMNVPSQDLRRNGVEAYIHGFLGGRTDYANKHSLVMGGNDLFFLYELIWLYGVAYPVTRNSWSGAVIVRIDSTAGSEVKVYIDKPAISSFSQEHRTFSEWTSLGKSEVSGIENIIRVLRIDNSGVLEITEEARRLLYNNIINDLVKGLDDVMANKDSFKRNKAAMEHLETFWLENQVSSTVKLPDKVTLQLEKAVKAVGIKTK